MTATAKVFQNGRSQAIRLPKECRVSSDEVYIEKLGNSLVITPKNKSKWSIAKEALEELGGIELERNQLPVQERELF